MPEKNDKNTDLSKLIENTCIEILMAGACRHLQMLSGFCAAGFGLLLHILFLGCCFALRSSGCPLEGNIFK